MPPCTYSLPPADVNPCQSLADGGAPWTAPVRSVHVRFDGSKTKRSAKTPVGRGERRAIEATGGSKTVDHSCKGLLHMLDLNPIPCDAMAVRGQPNL